MCRIPDRKVQIYPQDRGVYGVFPGWRTQASGTCRRIPVRPSLPGTVLPPHHREACTHRIAARWALVIGLKEPNKTAIFIVGHHSFLSVGISSAYEGIIPRMMYHKSPLTQHTAGKDRIDPFRQCFSMWWELCFLSALFQPSTDFLIAHRFTALLAVRKPLAQLFICFTVDAQKIHN